MIDAPARRAIENGSFHAANTDRVQSGQRFIKQQSPGRVEQSAGNDQFLFHPAG